MSRLTGTDPRPTADPTAPTGAPPGCYHGGAFFDAIGDRFVDLSRRHEVVNADVLDAWFDPAPGAVDALRAHLPWLARTSPPTDCGGLVAEIASARGLDPDGLVVGGGSSDLIFRAFPHWLNPRSRVLLLEPTYGEYAHVLERVIGCRVDRLTLPRDTDFDLDPDRLRRAFRRGYDLAVLVNPNNPTGRHLPRASLAGLLDDLPGGTRVWVDEAYVDYVGPAESVEAIPRSNRQVVVCKSLSKVYALSGLRAAYLSAHPAVAADLRALTPPWVVGLPAQVAAVEALRDPGYYRSRYADTARLRHALESGLLAAVPGSRVVRGRTNSVLLELPEGGLNAAELVAACREHDVYLRDAGATATSLGRRFVRVAVKDAATADKLLVVVGGEWSALRSTTEVPERLVQ